MPIQLQRIAFMNLQNKVRGDLWLPDAFDKEKRYASIVISGPGSSVKEQASGNYAKELAARGYVALAFDPSYQGESDGHPRDLESPAARVEDIRSAVDFLVTLPFVDDGRIGLLGICAGGGYAISAAMVERRIKAVGTVVASCIGTAFRRMRPQADAVEELLTEIGEQRSAEARGAGQRHEQWVPTVEEASAAGIEDPSTLNAVDYYMTPRGHDSNRSNKRLFTSDAVLLGYDAFHLVGELLVQPLQVIVAGKLGSTFSHEDGRRLWERSRNRKDFVVVEGADHYDLYDKAEYIEEVMRPLSALYDEHLRT